MPPRPFEELFIPASYKAFYGGRGSAKSHSFGRALVLMGTKRPLTILCCREIQLSISGSVKRLLDQVIDELGLRGFYLSTNNEIRGRNGTTITFKGLRTGPESVTSTEGIDIVWVEEAQTVSENSLTLLKPTVRKLGSELWFTWNPRFEKDPIDRMLRRSHQPAPSCVV
ncbi:MAG: phage terminase large subunit [Methyloceanibacter sp.]